jgi:hypothetical protein
MIHGRIRVDKVKVGEWRKRTFYDAYADGEYVGQYPTQKEAVKKAEARCESNDQRWKSLGEEFEHM